MRNGLLGLALVCAITGCAAQEDQNAANESQQPFTIVPTGGPAQLLITVPAGTTVVPAITAQRGQEATQTLTAGADKALTPGSYCVHVNLPLQGIRQPEPLCNIKVQDGARTTVALAAIRPRRESDIKVLGIDIPLDGNSESYRQTIAMLTTTEVVPMPAGTLDLLPYFYVDLAEGQVKDLVLDSAQGRASVTLLPPEPSTRTLPDVPRQFGYRFAPQNPRIIEGTPLGTTWQYTYVTKPIFFAAAYDSDVTQLGLVRSFNADASRALSLAGAGVSSYAMVRLDVADVEVTLADGTKQTVPGTFSVTSEGETRPLVSNAPTAHGIDLPAGEYTVKTTYVSPIDGTNVTTSQSASLH